MLHVINTQAKMSPYDHTQIPLIIATIYSYEPNALQLSLILLFLVDEETHNQRSNLPTDNKR